jgi:hypothetical protein
MIFHLKEDHGAHMYIKYNHHSVVTSAECKYSTESRCTGWRTRIVNFSRTLEQTIIFYFENTNILICLVNHQRRGSSKPWRVENGHDPSKPASSVPRGHGELLRFSGEGKEGKCPTQLVLLLARNGGGQGAGGSVLPAKPTTQAHIKAMRCTRG